MLNQGWHTNPPIAAVRDVLLGSSSDDTLYGGTENDILYGGFGNDSLIGGCGCDIFVLGDGEGFDMIVDFSKGQDSLYYVGENIKDLIISQTQTGTLISKANGDNLALLLGVEPSAIAFIETA